MALSMDEQRMLAEIERRLAAEDPGLAVRLSSFRRPSPAARFRTTRGRIIGSLFAVAVVAAVSLVVYAMIPFRAHTYKPATTPLASTHPVASAQVHSGPPASSIARTTAAHTTAAHTSAASTSAAKTAGHKASTAPSAAPKTASHQSTSSTGG